MTEPVSPVVKEQIKAMYEVAGMLNDLPDSKKKLFEEAIKGHQLDDPVSPKIRLKESLNLENSPLKIKMLDYLEKFLRELEVE